MVKAIYAFSGDPITYGHIDIVERVSEAFDEVTVAIGTNQEKVGKHMFSLEERTEMAKRSLPFPNVKVVSFEGMLSDYVYEQDIPYIVKGVRNIADFNYEQLLDEINKSQELGVDTLLMYARPELAKISSSTVKAILSEQGDIHNYVTLHVKEKLEEKMLGQYVIGVTGEIGAGKSYVTKKFENLGKKYGVEVHDIDLDKIAHQILGVLKEPGYQKVRNQIVNTFGHQVSLPDGMINRKVLGEIVFNDQEKLNQLNELMTDPLMVRTRNQMRRKKGLILLNAALIAEMDKSYLCNNNVVLINVDEESQRRRLAERNLDDQQIERRLASQYTFDQKKDFFKNEIMKHNQGSIWELKNSDTSNPDNIENTFKYILYELGLK